MLDKKVELVLLAAGASRRMRGEDKLLRHIEGVPLVRRTAEAALASSVKIVHVVVPSDSPKRQAALQGLNVSTIIAKDCDEGMAASLRAGIKAVSHDADAVIIALADMPDITYQHIDCLIAAFDPTNGDAICRTETEDGKAGHPVLFSRGFFERLMGLTGDHGAKKLLSQAEEFIISVPIEGQAVVTDLDTPEAWQSWLNAQKE